MSLFENQNLVMDSIENIREKDYSDMQVVSEALVKAGPEELENVAAILGWDTERIRRESEYAKMRAEVCRMSDENYDDRRRDGPPPDAEELSLGAYWEQIEPQVRDAVLILRRKGYNTYESGFYGFGAIQRISFNPKLREPIVISEGLREKLLEGGVVIESKQDGIELHFDRVIPIQKIKEVWDEVATMVPDTGSPAGPSIFSRRFTQENLKTVD